jgi:hypothetical protein
VLRISDQDVGVDFLFRGGRHWIMNDETIGFYTPLREVMRLRCREAMPRRQALNDIFFSHTVGQILGMPKTVLVRKLSLVPGSGTKTAVLVIEIIEELRAELCCPEIGPRTQTSSFQRPQRREFQQERTTFIRH